MVGYCASCLFADMNLKTNDADRGSSSKENNTPVRAPSSLLPFGELLFAALCDSQGQSFRGGQVIHLHGFRRIEIGSGVPFCIWWLWDEPLLLRRGVGSGGSGLV